MPVDRLDPQTRQMVENRTSRPQLGALLREDASSSTVAAYLDGEPVELRVIDMDADAATRHRFMQSIILQAGMTRGMQTLLGVDMDDSRAYVLQARASGSIRDAGEAAAWFAAQSPSGKVRLFMDVADALMCLHHNFLVHGDVNADHLLLVPHRAGGFHLVLSGCTFARLAPELSSGPTSCPTIPSDVYGLAHVVRRSYELHPFLEEDPVQRSRTPELVRALRQMWFRLRVEEIYGGTHHPPLKYLLQAAKRHDVELTDQRLTTFFSVSADQLPQLRCAIADLRTLQTE